MRILVVGAGLAGSAAGLMLTHDGHDVRVVDAVDEPYAGGYQILLDTAAVQVLHQLGAQAVVDDLTAPSAPVTVSRRGRVLTTLPTPGYRSARRGDLVGAVSRHAARTVRVEFGCRLVGLEQTEGGITARFADGSAEAFDLVIGADGLHSTVRRLAVEVDRSFVYDNGRINLWVDVPGRVDGLDHSSILFGDRAGAMVFPYTDTDESLVLAAFHLGAGRYDGRALLPLAADLLRGSGAEYAQFVPHVLDTPADRIRVTRFAQVRASRWHARNVVLVGDAAHCIDPLSGAGAHGGLVGAALVAEELRRTPDDVAEAATRYTRRARPFVRAAQLFTAGLLEHATARTRRQRFAAGRSLVAAALATRRPDVPQHTYAQPGATTP
jgi:2-polyprenyl-6-methoxyphenol hydroxylase-like FAD-dependent oxidoreductase